MKTPQVECEADAALIPAALVVLVEEFLESAHLDGYAAVEPTIDALRKSLGCTRREAQEALRIESGAEAAFVLAYERARRCLERIEISLDIV